MALTVDKVTDAELALARKLAPAGQNLGDLELQELLARDTALVPQRDPVTGETLMAAYGPLTVETVDVYGVLGDLWELEGFRLQALTEQPRRVRSETNADVSRSYDGGGPMTADQAFSLARRMRRKALASPGGARTVEVLPPYVQRGFAGELEPMREVTYGPGAPVPMGAPYQVNRPEVGQ